MENVMTDAQFEATTKTLLQLQAERDALNEKITEMSRKEVLFKQAQREAAKVAKELAKQERAEKREAKRLATLAAAEAKAQKAAERLSKLKMAAMNRAIGPVGVKAKRAAKKPGTMTVVEVK